MRKTDYDAAHALKNCRPYYGSRNTSVTIGGSDSAYMSLFGNRIAWNAVNERRVYVTFCGWDSNTTISRINAVLSMYNVKAQFCRRQGRLYISNNVATYPIDPNQIMFIDYTSDDELGFYINDPACQNLKGRV